MSAIKEITDLVIKLLEGKAARKFSGEVRQIQSAVSALQSEHATIIERDANTIAENLELKRKLIQMEEAHSKEIEVLHAKIKEFERPNCSATLI